MPSIFDDPVLAARAEGFQRAKDAAANRAWYPHLAPAPQRDIFLDPAQSISAPPAPRPADPPMPTAPSEPSISAPSGPRYRMPTELPGSIKRNAFPRGSGFGPFDSQGARSSAQMEQDAVAFDMIQDSYEPVFESIERDARRRPHPLDEAIAGRKRELAYEQLQPYDATSKISAFYGSGMGPLSGAEIGSEAVGEREMGTPTIGEARQVRMMEAQQRPKMHELDAKVNAVNKLERLTQAVEAARQQGKDPAALQAYYQRQRDAILAELTALAGQNLGFFARDLGVSADPSGAGSQ